MTADRLPPSSENQNQNLVLPIGCLGLGLAVVLGLGVVGLGVGVCLNGGGLAGAVVIVGRIVVAKNGFVVVIGLGFFANLPRSLLMSCFILQEKVISISGLQKLGEGGGTPRQNKFK